MSQVFIIAEVGSNWVGADPIRLIDAAQEAGADAIKFQIFRLEDTYVPNAGILGYLNGDVREVYRHFEMPYEMIEKLANYCLRAQIEFMGTPLGAMDFKALDPFVKRHKIASYENNHIRLLNLVAESGKPVIVSSGATLEEELVWTCHTLKSLGVRDMTLLQSLAQYPASPESINLRVIERLRAKFNCPVGLSDHTLDPFAAPLGAVSLGASVIEKHITLDRSLPGPEHAYAILPEEFKKMVKEIRLLEKMLGSQVKQIEPCEEEMRAFARRGIQAIADIKKGDLLQENINIAILRPGQNPRGAAPHFITQLQNTPAKRSFKVGEGVT